MALIGRLSGAAASVLLATSAWAIGDPEAGQSQYAVCTACHGINGEGSEALNAPRLAGQSSAYLERQLQNFQAGVRGGGVGDVTGQQMRAMASALTTEQAIEDVVAYIGTLPDNPAPQTVTGDANTGETRYAVCSACHGLNADGSDALGAPRLRGVQDWYLVRQLQNFKANVRGYDPTDPFGAQMQSIAATLPDEQAIRDVVAYINTLSEQQTTNPNVTLFASVLPASRSVQVGTTATIFATIINAGSETAAQCSIEPGEGSPPMDLTYQTTDAGNLPVGTPGAPVDIAAGGLQSFLVAIAPQSVFDATDVALAFTCQNAEPVTTITGVNTVLLSSDASPVADVIALAATVTNDGIAQLDPASGAGFFALASINVGAAADISVAVDTGGVSLPVAIELCQTNPLDGQCTNPTTPSTDAVDLFVGANETPTFTIIVTASETVALDPANHRLFVRFRDASGSVRGATSVAVERKEQPSRR